MWGMGRGHWAAVGPTEAEAWRAEGAPPGPQGRGVRTRVERPRGWDREEVRGCRECLVGVRLTGGLLSHTGRGRRLQGI